MAKKTQKPSVNHLRAWREFRQMSQEELAARVGTAGNVIGLLESGERGLSDKWLRRLAPELGTTAGFLLDYAPEDIDRDLLEAVQQVSAEEKPRVLQILQTFKRTA
jgi:transcriptional regulator with XRE-family HTH domain